MNGIDAAQKSKLGPAKINAVLVRGINDDEVEAFAEFARDRAVIMRSSNSCRSMPTGTGPARKWCPLRSV